MNWHTITLDKDSTHRNVHAHVQIDAESQWFDGHFPDKPILPGFAVLAMVFDTALLASEEKLSLKGFKKIRFKRPIKPGDRLEIYVESQNDSGSHLFTVFANGIQACKGTLIIDRFNKT